MPDWTPEDEEKLAHRKALYTLTEDHREKILVFELAQQTACFDLEQKRLEARLKAFHDCIHKLAQGWTGYDEQGRSMRFSPTGDNVLRTAALVVTGSDVDA